MKIKTTLGKFLEKAKDQSQHWQTNFSPTPYSELSLEIEYDDADKALDLTDIIKPTLPQTVSDFLEDVLSFSSIGLADKIRAIDSAHKNGFGSYNVQYWIRQHIQTAYLAAIVGYNIDEKDFATYFILPVCELYLTKKNQLVHLECALNSVDQSAIENLIFSRKEAKNIDLGNLGTPIQLYDDDWFNLTSNGFSWEKVGEIDG